MDKLNPVLQSTPLTTKVPESVSSWFSTEYTGGTFSDAEFAWMLAQGWKVRSSATVGGVTFYSLWRRSIRSESVLNDLVWSYTQAYNEGRQLNDQRYDDLVILYTSVLDRTEDAYNTLETDDATYEGLVEALIDKLGSDFDSYAADVDGDLDTWGTSLLAEINARFDAELGKARQALIDRGMYSGAMWTTISAGIERERTRALSDANDQIAQRQLELKHTVYGQRVNMRSRVLEARERLRAFLRNAKDRQVAVRNAAAEALARLVERRTDSYPDLAEVGRLAAGLGAGSPESFSP